MNDQSVRSQLTDKYVLSILFSSIKLYKGPVINYGEGKIVDPKSNIHGLLQTSLMDFDVSPS